MNRAVIADPVQNNFCFDLRPAFFITGAAVCGSPAWLAFLPNFLPYLARAAFQNGVGHTSICFSEAAECDVRHKEGETKVSGEINSKTRPPNGRLFFGRN
ncbi:hypothetical protein Zmor_000292 [Zophobas morio]|uniref:Uncharacterized protein n=1 Tax=Zophobas morio TaxID=2755281 RepID=A0AA38MQA5_9CUCU|nr:hypothetical protein Zmor_000292 [Zophobas morio]